MRSRREKLGETKRDAVYFVNRVALPFSLYPYQTVHQRSQNLAIELFSLCGERNVEMKYA